MSEHLLFLQSAQFPFPALTSGSTQMLLTPVAGDLKPASMRRQRRAGPSLEPPDQQASQTGESWLQRVRRPVSKVTRLKAALEDTKY